MRSKVKELLESLLKNSDYYIFNVESRHTGVCYIISSSGFDKDYAAYIWCERHTKEWTASTYGRAHCYVDFPINMLTPRRRQFVEYLLTQLHELPEDVSTETKGVNNVDPERLLGWTPSSFQES